MAATSDEMLPTTNAKPATEASGSAGQPTASLSGERADGLSNFASEAQAAAAELVKGSSSDVNDVDAEASKSSATLSAEQLVGAEGSEAMKDALAVARKLNATLSAVQVADVVHDVSKKAAQAVVDRLNIFDSLGSSALEKEAALDTDQVNAKTSGTKAADADSAGLETRAQEGKAEPCPSSKLNANLTDRRVAELKKVFESYDAEGTGGIPVSKLGAVMRTLGYELTDSNLQNILGPVKRTSLTFSEFITMIAKDVLAENTEEEFEKVFKVFDRNGDGFVSCAELRHAMTTLGQKLSTEDVDEMIRAADKDAKGKLTFDEFVTMVTSK